MSQSEIYTQLNAIFRDVLDNDDIDLTPETTAKDIEEWDSLTHIQLIVAIEKAFKTRFGALEIQEFKNVGDIVASLEKKG